MISIIYVPAYFAELWIDYDPTVFMDEIRMNSDRKKQDFTSRYSVWTRQEAMNTWEKVRLGH